MIGEMVPPARFHSAETEGRNITSLAFTRGKRGTGTGRVATITLVNRSLLMWYQLHFWRQQCPHRIHTCPTYIRYMDIINFFVGGPNIT